MANPPSSDADDRVTMALKEAFAGVGGSLWSSVLIYPIDLAKTRLQVPTVPSSTTTAADAAAAIDEKNVGLIDTMVQIVREEGVTALYTGLSSELVKSAVQHFVYFYVYSFMKDYAHQKYTHNGNEIQNQIQKLQLEKDQCACETPIPVEPEMVTNKAITAHTNTDNARKKKVHAKTTPASPPDRRHMSGIFMPQCCGACFKPIATSIDDYTIYGSKMRTISDAESNGHNRPKSQPLPIITNLIIGMTAGAVTQLFITPLSVVQTRIMTQKKHGRNASGIIGTMMHIVRTEGMTALFSGIVPSLVLTANPAVQFLVFDQLKHLVQVMLKRYQSKHKEYESVSVHAVYSFFLGAIAKIVATIVTYPYIMAKVRLQWKSEDDQIAQKYSGTFDVLSSILRKEGIFGLYTGLRAQMLKSVLGAALMFLGKEQIMLYSNEIVRLLRPVGKAKSI